MEEKKQIRKARAKKNGIIFYSNLNPIVGVETFIDESGKVKSKNIPTTLDEENCILEKMQDEKNDTWKVVFFDIFLVILSLLTRKILIVYAAVNFSIFASNKIFIFVKNAYEFKSKNGKEHSKSKFNAAKHMVLNAYNTLQRIPTFDEVKRASRYTKFCESNKIICEIIMYSLVSIELIIWQIMENHLLLRFIITDIIICAFLLVKIGEPRVWLKIFQFFTTTPPTDKEIEVAIEGVKSFEKMEKEIKEGKIKMVIHS